MPTIQSQLDAAFRAAIRSAFDIDSDPLVGVAQNEKFGDYQANAAMGLAKQLAERTGQKTNPRQVAEQIKAKLELGEIASEVTIAGPGFINVRLNREWLANELRRIAKDPRLGLEPMPNPQTVVVDYSGPNVAKQMHVGHLRSTIIGDALANVIEFQGHHVARQSHIGDWGTQFGMLIAFLRKMPPSAGDSNISLLSKDVAALGRGIYHVAINDLEEFYRSAKLRFDADPSFQDEARNTVVRLQRGEPEERAIWGEIVAETRRHYLPVYEQLGVKLGVANERGESFYNPLLPDVVADLRAKGLAVESQAPVDEADQVGHEDDISLSAPTDVREDRRIVVFNEGYKNPLIVQKTDGGYLYGTTDLAAVRYRTSELKAERIIYTHDSRQAQHFNQVFATAKRAGWAEGVSLEYAPFGTMLGEDGRPFKTRSGETVKLKDLLDEAEERAYALVTAKNPALPEEQRRAIARAVGVGAIKYADLSKDRVSDYKFSWDQMLSFEGNTAPYLQNAYVRVHGIFRKAKASGLDAAINYDVIRLESPFELALAKHILRFGDVIDLVTRELKPHHLCAFLYELATRYHAFFENCPVLQSEEPTRSSRLALCDVTARALALGLNLLGIEHPEQM